jgi:ATP-dependent Lon protease
MYSGVAARALHLSRGVEKPSGRVTYIVVLEGLCRFSVQELNARGSYHVARVSRLDMTRTGTALKVYIYIYKVSHHFV